MLYGLTCISEILREQNTDFRYRTMTRKRFRELSFDDAINQLSERILHNLKHAKCVVEHCHELGIAHYRIPEGFPLMTDPTLNMKWEMLPDYTDILLAMKDIGDTAKRLNIRIGSHPDQFVILCSYREDVCEKSIIELNQVSWFFDQMGLPGYHQYPINIHPSRSPKGDETPEEIIDLFYKNLMKCHPTVKYRLTVENEDKGFFSCENLYKYFHLYYKKKHNDIIPLVYDNLHNSINTSGDSKQYGFDSWLEAFKSTWPKNLTPVMHWSEGGKDGNSRSHVDYITENVGAPMDDSCVWELEVKAKDKAIKKLLEQKT